MANNSDATDLMNENQRLRDAIRRWRDADRSWDSIRWENAGQTKYTAAAELADAAEDLRKIAGETD